MTYPANGFVAYQGPSLLDGEPIVAIVTLVTSNRKTGPMAQLWILRADMNPIAAVHSGADASICGSCSLRGRVESTPDGPRNRGRGCYVVVWRGPGRVWNAWRRGRYETPASLREMARILRGRIVRLGAYGDPAAIPRRVLAAIVSRAEAWTGYTRQWREGFALQDLLMASTQSEAETREAESLGYRAFRIVRPGMGRLPRHMQCPASAERGHRVQCWECGACRGADGRRGHIQIAAHGIHPHLAVAAFAN